MPTPCWHSRPNTKPKDALASQYIVCLYELDSAHTFCDQMCRHIATARLNILPGSAAVALNITKPPSGYSLTEVLLNNYVF